MAKRTITALLNIAMLAFLISCSQAESENQSQNNPNPPENPTPPDNPTRPDNPTPPSSSTSGSTNGGVECNGYCLWADGCVIISTDPTGEYGTKITTCDAAITNCTKYSPSKQTYANNTCSGGTVTQSSLYCDYGPITEYGGGCFEIANSSECDTQWGKVVSTCGTTTKSSLYCDYGPITEYGGGCFEIANSSECDTQWGKVVNACGTTTQSSNSNNTPSGSVECSGYCKWDTGCTRISTDPTGEYGSVVSTCAAAISNCQLYSPSQQVYTNSTCNGGTITPGNSSTSSGTTSGTFTDNRDGRSYKWVKIGTQTWMAENLKYSSDYVSAVCYNNDPANCAKYGALYEWKTAKSACPSGWHLPNNAEWNTLVNYVGGGNTAGKKLKATSGWNSNGNGTDTYGFAALPGGTFSNTGKNGNAGNQGYWWSASEYAYWSMVYYEDGILSSSVTAEQELQISVRCVQN